jgi:lipoate-protein ligase A
MSMSGDHACPNSGGHSCVPQRPWRHISGAGTDPCSNLALEHYVFDSLDPACNYFLLWRNDNAVIIGKHQNAFAEVNARRVRDLNTRVVRRLSGGGAVYQDLGNINFTFIADGGGPCFDSAVFCRLMAGVLESMGVPVAISSRGGLAIGGRKCSGSAQYIKRGRVLHHGTLLYDSDLRTVERVLRPAPDELTSRAVQSVRSRVTNIRPHMRPAMATGTFFEALRAGVCRVCAMRPHELTPADMEGVAALRRDVYDRWDWNYGASPPHSLCRKRRIAGCGGIELRLEVRDGRIRDAVFSAEVSGRGDSGAVSELLRGCPLEESALRGLLSGVDVGAHIPGLDGEGLMGLLLW